MLYRLELENFYSVRDTQVLDLSIPPNVPEGGNRFAALFPGSPYRAPKVVAIYGANASGKTTILKALNFLFSFARESVQRTVPGFAGLERFNDTVSMSRPIRLAVELGGIMDLTPDAMKRIEAGEVPAYGLLRYELEIEVKDGAAIRVTTEALRQRPDGKGKWQRVFERDEQGDVKGSTSFPITGYRHLLNTLQPNVSVISSFAMFQHPLLVEQLSHVISNLGWDITPNDRAVVNFLASNSSLVDALNADLRRIDIGVEAMRIDHGPDGPFPMFKHEGLELEMPWQLESGGTRAFIRIFPLLSLTLARGGIAIIDEFDLMIHPLVLPEILAWFHGTETRNPRNAQLWITCHSASLLDDLAKEEIVFAEKDSGGRTSIYSLMDIKAVRRGDNIYSKYLSGAYGAVPHIG
ncbi:AAA family ATPase [Polymorphobacter sp.]|uniref:AAA family ATPase n=1 Tax=Polymorphobacter sp. TaxID=1909290 RepID=UPI003F71C201